MILTAKYSDIGGREVNEDSMGIYVRNGCICATVADGVGGHGGGDKASSLTVNMLERFFSESTDVFPANLYDWVQKINQSVYGMQTDTCKMKTTFTALFTNGIGCMWAHIGDTRIYHFINGVMNGVTRDHSVSQMAVFAGEITEDEIRHHADRNKLTRALGSENEVKLDISDVIDVTSGWHAFLLCSDGFWEYVLENEMEELLHKSQNPIEWLEGMRKYIQERAPKNNDNNTAVAVWIKNEGE